MLENLEPHGESWLSPQRQNTVSVVLRRLELGLEVAFLVSFAVTLSGLLVIAPQWQPAVRIAMPLGVGYAVIRRGWLISAAIGVLSVLCIPLFPHALGWDGFFAATAAPVWLATGWAYKTHRPAAWRWVATVMAMGVGQWIVAWAFHPHPNSAILNWSVSPMMAMVRAAGLGWPAVIIRPYWQLGFFTDQVLAGTAIFLLLAFFADLAALPLPQVPLFGRWKMPRWVLAVFTAVLLAIGWSSLHRPVPAGLTEAFVVLAGAYLVVGVNVLWELGQLIGLSRPLRIGLLLLLAADSWIGLVLVGILGVYDSIWNLRDYIMKLRRPT